MAKIRDHVSGTGTARPGVGGELKQLKSNGQASAGELREFIGSLKGRSPQEVLGVVAQSGLTRAMVIATGGFLVLLIVATIVPYGYHKIWPADTKPQAAQTSADEAPEESGETARPAAATSAADAVPAGAEDLPDRLGIGETKASDPNKNPLDSNKIDNLLDGID